MSVELTAEMIEAAIGGGNNAPNPGNDIQVIVCAVSAVLPLVEAAVRTQWADRLDAAKPTEHPGTDQYGADMYDLGWDGAAEFLRGSRPVDDLDEYTAEQMRDPEFREAYRAAEARAKAVRGDDRG